MRILVVCGGNTCRSPAAAAAIEAAAARAGLEMSVSSAGVAAGNSGASPTQTMVDLARERGLELSGRARQIEPGDLDVDLVLALDGFTKFFVESLPAAAPPRVELLGSYDESEPGDEIADPFGGDRDTYAATLDRIIASADGLIRRLSD